MARAGCCDPASLPQPAALPALPTRPSALEVQTDLQTLAEADPRLTGWVYADCMAFGMGCCCLQVIFLLGVSNTNPLRE